MVTSKEMYTTQKYCEKFLGFCPIVSGVQNELRHILDSKGLNNLWDYPLDEIDEIVKNNINVVLVDTTYIGDNAEMVHEYRWFEVSNKN